ncbi:MAG: protein kinase [Phycisphaerales bacterium]
MSESHPDQIGAYTIDRELGRGGMGVVYLGRDTRLDRRVAVKALPEHLAHDPDRLARFEREARTLASLSHPNVAGIYGVEEHGGARFLVLEFVEGESLAERLDRGPLAPDEAIDVAAQIAAGLEAAHDAGVIHRDLKPGNIMVTPDGQAKILDFGLARTDDSASSSAMDESPTLTSPAPQHSPTVPGVILGTAAYMSPEQARGRRVDKRTDIWSFGVVLFEMLRGASPFAGETVTDSIGAILHKDIDLAQLPPGTPAGVERVLRRCLERDRTKRLRDIGDARLELLEADAPPAHADAPLRRAALWPFALIAGLALGGAGVWALAPSGGGPDALPEPRRYSISLPESAPIAPPSAYPFGVARRFFDLSPNGDAMAYSALVDGAMSLYTRDMATGEVSPVTGGSDGFSPAYAKNGRRLAFFANERMLTLDLDGPAQPQTVVDASSPGGAVWSSDGTIYYSPAEMAPIMAIPSAGGTPRKAASSRAVGNSLREPVLTPDERSLLYTDYLGGIGVYAMSIDAAENEQPRLVAGDAANGRVTPDGYLLFTRDNRLMGVRIDPETLEIVGDPVTLVSSVRMSWGRGQWALSNDDALVYAEGINDETAEFVWRRANGSTDRLDLGLRQFVAFALSPDGRRLATPIADGRDQDIWLYDLDRPQTPARITFGGVYNGAQWSSDGRHLLFTEFLEDGGSRILAKDIRSGAPPFVIHESPLRWMVQQHHAPSGELLVVAVTPENGLDLMRGVVDLAAGEGATLERIEPLRATRYGEPFAAISPDRRWIVANSDETGRWELYLSSYPEFESRVQISTDGAEEPRWTADGSRVIYRWNDTWYEVEVTTEPRLTASPPRVIAQGPYINVAGYSWDMTGDGENLLLLEGPQQDAPVTELQVITNFTTELRRRLGDASR